MSLDHGILNVPLTKRGNIDSQIDAYKATQAAEAKAERKVAAATMRANKAQAKKDLAELIAADWLLDLKAAGLGVSRSRLIAVLTDWSKWQPERVIKARAEWLPNQSQI